MQLLALSETNKNQYNSFVAAQGGSFLQSWEWGDWQAALRRQVARFFVSDDGKNIASVQFVKMPLWGKRHYAYAPYGPILGDEKLEVGDWTRKLREKFPSAMFVRVEPQKQIENLISIAVKSANIQPAVTMVLDVNKPDDVLLAGMHEKTRYNIRLAIKHGVLVQSELIVTPGHGLYASEAVNLILQTQKRQNYRGHSAEYYKQLINFFGVQNSKGELKIRIYKALYQKQLLASAVMVDFGPTRTYLYGGSSEEHKNVMAPHLLHWQAIIDARESGLLYYDLGGSEVSGGGERGFTRFKEGFGGTVVNFMGAYDIVQNKLQYKIYKAGRMLNKLRINFVR